jgi:L-lactate dehydrogenase
VAGVRLADFAHQTGLNVRSENRIRIDDGVRRATYRIIAGKGATYFGIGAGLARIVRAIRSDERAVLTLATRALGVGDFPEVCFPLPRIVGAAGISATFLPELSADEHRDLRNSVGVIQRATEELGF